MDADLQQHITEMATRYLSYSKKEVEPTFRPIIPAVHTVIASSEVSPYDASVLAKQQLTTALEHMNYTYIYADFPHPILCYTQYNNVYVAYYVITFSYFN